MRSQGRCKGYCSALRNYRISLRFFGMEELSEADKVLVGQGKELQRFLSHALFFVADSF
nr:hypothetical protein [Candidatus Kuenenia stuttgartiensis]